MAKKQRPRLDLGVLKFTVDHPYLWWFRAKVVEMIDGDTVELLVDRGFRTYQVERIRIHGINAPEAKGSTSSAAAKTTNWLMDQIPLGTEILIHSTGEDPREGFGRWLAQIWKVVTLNEALDHETEMFREAKAETSDEKFVTVISDAPGLINLGAWMIQIELAVPYKRKKT